MRSRAECRASIRWCRIPALIRYAPLAHTRQPSLNWSRGFEPLQYPCSVLNAPRAHFGTVWSSTTMFVRWQEYKSRAKSRRLRAFRKKHGPHRLRAILVETVRIDGKPHQRYLAYLGSVQADRRDRPRFWYGVTRKLDQCRLSRERRQSPRRSAVRCRPRPSSKNSSVDGRTKGLASRALGPRSPYLSAMAAPPSSVMNSRRFTHPSGVLWSTPATTRFPCG